MVKRVIGDTAVTIDNEVQGFFVDAAKRLGLTNKGFCIKNLRQVVADDEILGELKNCLKNLDKLGRNRYYIK